jgi:hypothetical protein
MGRISVNHLACLGALFLALGGAGLGCGNSEPQTANEKAVAKLEDAGITQEQAKEEVRRINRQVMKRARREKEASDEKAVREAATKNHHPESTATATCTLEGKRAADVSLEYTSEGFDLTFAGQPVPSNGTALYSATVFDDTGEHGVQLGVKYLDGEQIAYFVFSFDTYEQTNLNGAASVNGNTVSASFPAADLGPLRKADPASWSAAFSVEGNDVGECPGGIDSLPFPR